MKKSGAEILWECVTREGVEVVFGYPGGANMPIYDAMLSYPVHHVLVRHEQGASHMADGYARASGKVGVAMATSGPGATNLVTGIVTAMMDSVPMVCITGQVASHLIGGDARSADGGTADIGPVHRVRGRVGAGAVHRHSPRTRCDASDAGPVPALRDRRPCPGGRRHRASGEVGWRDPAQPQPDRIRGQGLRTSTGGQLSRRVRPL